MPPSYISNEVAKLLSVTCDEDSKASVRAQAKKQLLELSSGENFQEVAKAIRIFSGGRPQTFAKLQKQLPALADHFGPMGSVSEPLMLKGAKRK